MPGEARHWSSASRFPSRTWPGSGESGDRDPGPAPREPARPSIWSAIHPRLLDLVREHRSTLIFANSRRIAERLAAALNELAGEPLVRAHHGSLARERRTEIEDQLKAGALRALVATSSLELGIDMGAVDLVIQIEAPPSVASGLQRIGRAGHQVGAASRGHRLPEVPRGISWRAPPPPASCGRAGWKPRAIRAIRSTFWPSRSWPWWPWTAGAPSTSSPPCGARRPSPR